MHPLRDRRTAVAASAPDQTRPAESRLIPLRSRPETGAGQGNGAGIDDERTGREEAAALRDVTESAGDASLARVDGLTGEDVPEPERRARAGNGGEHQGELPRPVATLYRVGSG